MKLASVLMVALLAGCSADKDDTNSQAAGSAHTSYETASTEQVVKALNNNDWVVVDTRLNDAFNGWKLDGVSRGGHIAGAVDFSANWLKVKADDSSEVLYQSHFLNPLLRWLSERKYCVEVPRHSYGYGSSLRLVFSFS